jgi:hypothetical protein
MSTKASTTFNFVSFLMAALLEMEDVVAARARLQLALSLSPDDPAIKTELARFKKYIEQFC